MSAKNTKLITFLLLGILLGVLVCILACAGAVAANSIVGDDEQLPRGSLKVTIDESQREALFDQFQKFSEKHGFEISIRDSGLSDELFQVYMSRYDLKIIGRNPFDPRIFRIGFYNKYPGLPASQDAVDNLVNDLKAFISEIPNVTITEE